MTNERVRIRSLTFALIALALVSLNARAQEAADTFLSDLHTFRISNYIALDAFYRYSGTQDPAILQDVVNGINAANDAMNTVAKATNGVLSKDAVEDLNQEFDKFKALMRDNINVNRKQGYPDLRLMSDMANQALTMSDKATELYKQAQDSAQLKTDDRVEAARMAAVKMAQMMAKYSARTNSSNAQTFQGAANEKALDQQAKEFDGFLEQLGRGRDIPALKDTIDEIRSKWEFIRGSYINYNQNNVSFVIDRYSKGILSALNTAIDLLQQSQKS